MMSLTGPASPRVTSTWSACSTVSIVDPFPAVPHPPVVPVVFGPAFVLGGPRGVPGRSGRAVSPSRSWPVLSGSGRDRPGGSDAGRAPPITPAPS